MCLNTDTLFWIQRWCFQYRWIEMWCFEYKHSVLNTGTVEPVLKDHPIGHKIMATQDRWSLGTSSFTLKCVTFCQTVVVLPDRWSLMAVVCEDRFHCTHMAFWIQMWCFECNLQTWRFEDRYPYGVLDANMMFRIQIFFPLYLFFRIFFYYCSGPFSLVYITIAVYVLKNNVLVLNHLV